MKFIYLFLLLICGSGSLFGQSITTTVSSDSLSPGDPFQFTIISSYQSANFNVVYPDEKSFNDPFEFLSVQRFKDISNRDSIVYQLQYFGVKDTILTSKPVYFINNQDTLVLDTAPIPIYLKSNLDTNATELQPFKPIFEFARSWIFVLLLSLILLIIALLIWYYRDRLFSKESMEQEVENPVEIPVFVNPFSLFEKNIQKLKSLDQYSADHFKEWHIELSNAIRSYYETAHRIPALESTTREFVFRLQQSKFPEDITDLVKTILKRCDLIKFAKVQGDMHSCVQLLDQTEVLKDLIRFNDETLLRRLKTDHEIRYGLRHDENASKSVQSEPKTVDS